LLREPGRDLVAGPGVLEGDRQLEGAASSPDLAELESEAAPEQQVAPLVAAERDPSGVELGLIDVGRVELGGQRDVDAGEVVGRELDALARSGRDPQLGPLARSPRLEPGARRAAATQGAEIGLAGDGGRGVTGYAHAREAAH